MYLVQWITLCVIYPRLWCDRQGFRATAAAELRWVPIYVRLLQVMAGLIPLIAASDDVRGAARIERRPAHLPLPRRKPDHPRNGRVSPGHVRRGLVVPGLGRLDRLERNRIAAPAGCERLLRFDRLGNTFKIDRFQAVLSRSRSPAGKRMDSRGPENHAALRETGTGRGRPRPPWDRRSCRPAATSSASRRKEPKRS